MKDKLWPKLVIFGLVSTLIPAALLFGAAGRLDWLMGWLLIFIATAGNVISRVMVYKIDPEVLLERGRFASNPGIKKWDQILVPVLGVLVPFAVLVVSALDWRFRWSDALPPVVPWAALVVFTAAMVFGSWALVTNRFFSSHVRIQTERGHYVVKDGPYRLVRHPGYLGAIIMYLMIPLILDGLWGLVPALIYMAGFMVRTRLEDRTLQRELAGYAEYADGVKYRLLPGVW